MTLHQIWVLYAGLMFCVDALVIFGAVKAMGPAYRDRITVGWRVRGPFSALAVICLIRGITLVFPGRSVHVQFVPWMVPAMATALFVAALVGTDWVISHRAPPPVMHRIQAAIAALAAPRHADYAKVDQMMLAAGVPRPTGDDAVRFSGPRLRYIVIGACALGLLILLLVIVHAAAAELPLA